jgi:putative IMPACT (imprinted ancient) family translation regulator
VEAARLEVDLPYHLFDRFRTAASEAGALLLEESFDEAVHVAVEIPVSDLEAFRSRVVELSSGAVVPRLVSTRMARHQLG